MSLQMEVEAIPAVGAAPSLAWLINPISPDQFFANYWEKRTLVVRRDQPNYFQQLLTLEELDRVITTLDRRYPDITLKNASRAVTAADYTVRGNTLDVAKVYQLFQEGSTITLAFLQDVVPALTVFCRTLEREFSHPFQTNVYLTPAWAQGAKPHYDTHDVFVLQVAGSKEWTIYGTPVELPLSGQEFDEKVHQLGATTMKFVLNEGDVAYIPRGVAHDAHSTDVASLHITAGILRYTWTDLLLECVAHASLNDPALRKALPPGFAHPDFNRAQAQETLRNLLQQVCTAPNFDAAFDRFVDESISASPPFLVGQMAQLAAVDRLTIDGVTGARPGANYRLQTGGDSIAVECYGRRITLPLHAEEAVRFALSHDRFGVREIPGNLDDAGKLTLIRRLIREGLALAHTL